METFRVNHVNEYIPASTLYKSKAGRYQPRMLAGIFVIIRGINLETFRGN